MLCLQPFRFDSTCKFLVESFSADFATWLLGEPIKLTAISPAELSLEPIRADALILYAANDLILHLEFQTDPKANIPFWMADYRLRGHRRYPDQRRQQTVIYLRQTNSDLVYQTTFRLERTLHEFNMIRLWEQPTAVFLHCPGLLPLAALTQAQDRAEVLRQVSDLASQIPDEIQRNNSIGSTAILAGLVLEQDRVERILRRDIVKESTVYQSLREEILEEKMREIA